MVRSSKMGGGGGDSECWRGSVDEGRSCDELATAIKEKNNSVNLLEIFRRQTL